MKFIKYTFFISILASIFVVVYRQADEDDLDRWKLSLKKAIIFSAMLAGLICINSETIAMESSPKNNPIYCEKIIKTSNDTKVKNNYQEGILVKTGGNSPISTPTNFVPKTPSGPKPTAPVRPNPPPVYVPRHRTVPKLSRHGFGGGPGGNGGDNGDPPNFDDQCSVPKKEQPPESNTVYDSSSTSNSQRNKEKKKEKKKSKRTRWKELKKLDLSLEDKKKALKNSLLLELATNPSTDEIDQLSFDEAESIMQAQRETLLFKGARRPNLENGERNIDFKLYGSRYNEGDIKMPKSFFKTKKGLAKRIPEDMLNSNARESGANSIRQKNNSKRCLHILDLKDILPHQKESYKRNFLKGARETDPELVKDIIVQND